MRGPLWTRDVVAVPKSNRRKMRKERENRLKRSVSSRGPKFGFRTSEVRCIALKASQYMSEKLLI